MDEAKVFAVLGIERTQDEDAIKNAYRQKLHTVNPEDDPEGFKQLRAAYESAMELIAQAGKEDEETDETPSGLFVRKASALYHSLAKRQDESAWRALFAEPEFLDLEEEENCREKMVVFLMKHCYFPTQVWKELDRGLQITADRDKFYEKFPKDFIDFVVRKVERGEDFEFEQLTGPDDADLDGWIFLFSKAGREENEKNYEAMAQTLQEAKEKQISHPALSIMEARLCLAKGETAQGDAIVEALLQGDFADTLNVRYQSAEYFWESGSKDRAAEIYLRIRSEDKKHYMANRRLAQWYRERQEWTTAKECINVILAYPLDEEGKELVNGVNAGLSRALEEKLAQNPADLKARMDLGWCYLQDEEPEKAMELMEHITPDAASEKDYANLMGKVFYYGKRYDRAVPLIGRWISLLTEQMPTEGQEREDDHERLATGHSMLAQIHQEEAKEKEGTERDEAFLLVMRELDAAKEAHYNPGQDYARALAYLEWEKYEECRTICEELKEKYPDFAAAFMLHQKASAKLFDAGSVIGDYFALRQLQPDYAGSWELAAEVYYQVKRTEELDRLLADAEENNIRTACLKKYRFFRMADQAQKKEELIQALSFAESIGQEGKEEGWSVAEQADFLSDRARNYWRIDENDTALSLIDQAIALFPEKLMYAYIKAGIKKDLKQYAEALKLYLSCKEDYDETAHFYANVGECYYRLNQVREALPYLKKSVELNPDNPACCTWIERIYRIEMERKNSLEDMEEAVRYASLMVEHRGSSFDYIERGLLYVLAQDYETAAQDFVRAAEADSADPFAYSNLARMYRLLNRLPEAEEQAKQAIAHMEQDPAPYHYEMLGRVYWQMHRYEDALNAFFENWKRFPQRRESFVDDIVSLYVSAGKWQAALEFLDGYFKEKNRRYIEKVLEVYCCTGHFESAARFFKQRYRGAGYDKKSYEWKLAEIAWYQGENETAAGHIREALRYTQPGDMEYPKVCKRAADIFFFSQDYQSAQHWAKEALAWYRDHGGFARWLNPLEDRLRRMFFLGSLQLYAGNLETARAVVGEMRPHPRCIGCHHCVCADAMELEADILAAQGSVAGAIGLYEEILKENGTDREVRTKLAALRKRG